MKAKRLGKKDVNTKTTQRCVIKEKTEELSEKPLCRPPSGNQSTRKSVGIHKWAKDPPSLIYPMHLSPPSSYSNKASRNCVLSSSTDPQYGRLHPPKPGFFQCFPTAPKPHWTLWKSVVNVWAINHSMVWKWRGRSWGKSTSNCVENCGYNNL